MLRDSILKVTDKPGVYIWKDCLGKIIYIGKAKNLRKRMLSYFSVKAISPRIEVLVDRIRDFEILVCSSPREALLLERNLIKEHRPHFNVLLKDDKRYPYIKVSNDSKRGFSIEVVYRFTRAKNSFFFGPFPEGYGAKILSNLLRRETSYRDGLLITDAPNSYWEKQFVRVKRILLSGGDSYIKNLEKRMEEAAERLNFEISAEYKRAVDFFKKLKESQIVELGVSRNYDFFDFFEEENLIFVKVFHYRLGVLIARSENVFEIKKSFESDVEFFINDFYINRPLPDKIFLDPSLEYVKDGLFFEEEIISFKPKGRYKKVLGLLRANNLVNKGERLNKFVTERSSLVKILGEFKLKSRARNISSFIIIDTSFTPTSEPVVAISYFKDGVRIPSLSRRYRLSKEDRGLGYRRADVEYLREGLTRYLSSEVVGIDTVVVDGALAQINEAKKVLRKLNLDLDVIGLPKDERHLNLGIIDTNLKLVRDLGPELSNYINRIQVGIDSTAKIAKRKHSLKSIEDSSLLRIKGVGKRIEARLLSAFGSYQTIRSLSVEQLSEVVGKKVAIRIFEGLNGL